MDGADTVTDEEKISLVKSFYEARADGDVDKIRSFLSDDVVWHEPDIGAEHTGDLIGAETVVGMIRAAQAKTAGTFSLVPIQVVANGEHAVALIDWSAKKNETVLEGREVAVFRIREGKILEVSFHQDDMNRDREFWS